MHTTSIFSDNSILDFIVSLLFALFFAFLLSKFITRRYHPKRKKTVLLISILVPLALFFTNVISVVILHFPLVIGGVGWAIIGYFMYYQLREGVVDHKERVINHHENGSVASKGYMMNRQKVGVWEYYDEQSQFLKEVDHDLEKAKSEEANTASNKRKIERKSQLLGLDHEEFQKHVKELRHLVQKEKKALLGSANKQNILDLLQSLCVSEKQTLHLLDSYEEEFDIVFLDELKGLSSSYSGIKEYMTPFIELGIVTSEHPHDRIEK